MIIALIRMENLLRYVVININYVMFVIWVMFSRVERAGPACLKVNNGGLSVMLVWMISGPAI